MNKHEFSLINCIILLHYQTLRWILVVLRFMSWRVKSRIQVNTWFQHFNSTWILSLNIMTQLEYLISKFWLKSSLDELRTQFNLDDLTHHDQFNSSKINIIVNWLILINVKDVQSFLDFANFYKRFIYNYSRIVILLTHLIRKDVLFVWFQKCQIAFNILKKIFTFKIILHHYNSDHKIVIEINASNYVFKNILFQYNENEILHLVAYFLKKHNSVECNYEIYDKELMIIVCTFKKWWSKLEDFIYSVEMIMNHKNLEYFMSIKQLSHHQTCWSEFLSKFNYHITYYLDKIDDKLKALTCHSKDFFKEKDTFDSWHQYQYQIILKTHVLNFNIIKNLILDVFDINVMKLQS